MELRPFQIIVPILALAFIINELLAYRGAKSTIYKMLITISFWIGLTALSIFPDFFSNAIARTLGIKDNINAILFSGLGLLFYFQLRLFNRLKKQEDQLTELSRKMALKYPDEKL